MADHNPPPNNDSANPLFNKMDALMARHRNGPAASMDDIPVLTEVATKPIPSLFDVVDEIPSLTDVVEPNLADKIAHLEQEWAFDHREPDIAHLDLDLDLNPPAPKPVSLEIDPLPFRQAEPVSDTPTLSSPSTKAAPLTESARAWSASTPTSPIPLIPEAGFKPPRPNQEASESIFLDLPMLDLDELTRTPAPEYLDLPLLSTTSKRDVVNTEPSVQFVATDLMLPLDEVLSPSAESHPEFVQALTEASLIAAEIPHLDAGDAQTDASPLTQFASTPQTPSTSNQPPDETITLAAFNEAEFNDFAAQFTQQKHPSDTDLAVDLAEPSVWAAPATPAEPLAIAPTPSTPPASPVQLTSTPPILHWDDEPELLLYSSPNDQGIASINLDDNSLAMQSNIITPAAVSIPVAPTTPPAHTMATEGINTGDRTDTQHSISTEPLPELTSEPIPQDERSNLLAEHQAESQPSTTFTAEIAQAHPAIYPALLAANANDSEIDTKHEETDTQQGIFIESNSQEESKAIPPVLSPDSIAEITASVGAQLSLDIATEVEKLAKQHFDTMMAQFYSDALRKLTDEIMESLEEQLSQRIVDLVEVELRSKGLL